MTDFEALLRPDRGGPARNIHLVDKDAFGAWAKRQSAAWRHLLEALRFDGKTGYQFALLPLDGGEYEVVATVAKLANLSPWCLARLGEALPAGTYRLAQGDPGALQNRRADRSRIDVARQFQLPVHLLHRRQHVGDALAKADDADAVGFHGRTSPRLRLPGERLRPISRAL